MEIATVKYQFIEEIVEQTKTPDWLQFAGIWNDEEANEISQNIKDCENINLDEW